MSQRMVALIGFSMLFASLPVAAQENTGTVARIAWFKARPGMEKQLEEGVARHMEWHKKVSDPRAWHVWQVTAGEKTGWFVGGVFGRRWSDFDNPPVSSKEDGADAEVNTAPYIGPVKTEFLTELPELSRPPASTEPGKLIAMNVVRVKMGKRGEYLEAVRKTKEAMDKVDYYLRYYVEEVTFGGQYHTFYFIHPVSKWADFEPRGESFAKFLNEVYGAEETRRILKVFGDAVAEEHTLLLSFRLDLSYTPAE